MFMRRGLLDPLKKLRTGLDLLAGRPQSCYLGRGRVLARLHGFKMLLPAHDVGIVPHLLMDGYFEVSTGLVLRRLIRPGMTVIDVGAHVGYFTVQMAAAVGPSGKCVAFEALPDNAWYVRKNIDLAGATPWTRVIEKGLWHESGTARLRTHTEHTGGNSLVGGDTANAPEEGFVEVPTTTLDDALGDDRRVDLIKIDAEAAEPFILEGMADTLAANPRLTILLEFHPLFVESIGRDPRKYLHRFRDEMGFAVGLIEPDGAVTPIDFENLDGFFEHPAFPAMLLLQRGGA
jgi:FkbM family methyltransferase